MASTAASLPDVRQVPDALGRFGPYGGKYVPETLSAALDQLETAYAEASHEGSHRQPLYYQREKDATETRQQERRSQLDQQVIRR